MSSWISPGSKTENVDIVKQGDNFLHFKKNETVNSNQSQCGTEMLGTVEDSFRLCLQCEFFS